MCCLTFLLCCAWGATGHKVIAQIAYDHLTPKAKAEVDTLLAGSTLPEFSVWPDLIKDEPNWRWTRPWHFADMPEGAGSFKMDRDCPEKGCVVRGILRYGAELKSGTTSFEDRQRALKFLSHYVGDIHQPLHAGRAADKGGNAIQVQLYSRGTNLHAVWDEGLIKRRGMEYQAYARKLEEGIKPAHLATFTAFMDPPVWASESHLLADEFAYRDHRGNWIKNGDTLGDDYATKNTPTVDEQLTKAGLRLARMLNDIFDPGSAMPATPAAPIAAPPPDPPKSPSSSPSRVKFVGSRNSDVYHYPGCPSAQKIAPKNLVEYSEAPAGKRLHQGCPR
jgi:hypothetical protein